MVLACKIYNFSEQRKDWFPPENPCVVWVAISDRDPCLVEATDAQSTCHPKSTLPKTNKSHRNSSSNPGISPAICVLCFREGTFHRNVPHIFFVIGDKLINLILAVYIPTLRISHFFGGMSSSPIFREFHRPFGTYDGSICVFPKIGVPQNAG